jgi:hypothetical protein
MRVLKPAARLCILFMAAFGAAAQTGDEFHLGPIEAPRGSLKSGYLAVPPGEDGEARIPVSVLHGARAGPVLALVAGTHGYEYPPITALQRLRRTLDPADLAGTVILVHVANPPSFLGRSIYYSPADGKNRDVLQVLASLEGWLPPIGASNKICAEPPNGLRSRRHQVACVREYVRVDEDPTGHRTPPAWDNRRCRT